MTSSYSQYLGMSNALGADETKKEEPKKKKSATDSLTDFGAKVGKKAGKDRKSVV